MRSAFLIVAACLAAAGCSSRNGSSIEASAPRTALVAAAPASSARVAGQAADAAVPGSLQVSSFLPPGNPPFPSSRPWLDGNGMSPGGLAIAQAAPGDMAGDRDTGDAASGNPHGPDATAPAGSAGRSLLAYETKVAGDPDRPLQPGPVAAGQRWRAAYRGVSTGCFPASLQRAMNTIAIHFGREVLVTSGWRGRGRRGSLHRSCRAADIRVAGVSPSRLAAFARTVTGINGVGTYRRTSVTHIDVRTTRFAWRY